MSICTQYLLWGFESDGITDTHLIDLQQLGTELFLFLADSGPQKVDIPFEPFEKYAQRLRDYGMNPSDITKESYAESLAAQVESLFAVVPTTYDQFMDDNWQYVSRNFDIIDMYKEFLRVGVGKHEFPTRGVKRKVQASISLEPKRPHRDEEKDVDMDELPHLESLADIRRGLGGLEAFRAMNELPPLESQADVRRGMGGLEAFRAVTVGRDTKWLKVDPVAPLESLDQEEPPANLDKLLFVKPRATYYFYPEFDEDQWEDDENGYLKQKDTYSNGKLEVANLSDISALKHLGPHVTHLVLRGQDVFRGLTLARLVAAFPNLEILDTKGELEQGFFANLSPYNKLKELHIEDANLDDYDDIKEITGLKRLSIDGEHAMQ
jgi:hypothetical protein